MLHSLDAKRLSEQARNEAEGYVQAALNAMTAHIALLDENGKIIAVNSAWRDYAEKNGFKDLQYGIGTNYLNVCDNSAKRSSKDAGTVAKGIRSVMSHTKPEFYIEYPCHTPQEKRWYVMRVSRFEWYGLPRYIVAHQNITELKRVQLELEESQTRLQTILDTVVSGILMLDNNIVEMANPAAVHIFGYEPGEIEGKDFNELLGESCELNCLDNNIHYELVGKRKDGSLFPINFAMNEVFIGDRRMLTIAIQDITDRKRMESELVEKERLSVLLEKEREMREYKARFLSTMSHELRTPLTSIRLSYDMLTTYAEQTSEEERVQYLANIRSQVEYLTDLVKDVLTLSKGEIQQLEFAPERADLLTYCRSITEEFQLTYHKSHRVEFTTDCMRVEALLDKKLLRQAFTNLLSNAIKYSPQGGRVRFELLCAGEEALIRISDQGIGIPESDLPTLFEPFRRASNVENLPGTGLGLAIAKQAIEVHGGSISVESKLGEGTTFVLRLPILHADPITDEDEWE